MIGNQEDAELIAYYFAMALEHDNTAVRSEYDHFSRGGHGVYTVVGQILPGWEMLGQGMYRVAYLSPDNVVYKVQWRMADIGNATEHRFMRNHYYIKKWAIKTELYSNMRHPTAGLVDVIACEYVPGDFPPDVWELPSDAFERVHDTYADVEGIIVSGKALALLRDVVGYVHDVHSENVKVTPDGGLKLLDAGS